MKVARGRHGSRRAAQRAAAAAFLAAPPERCVPPITGFTYMAPTVEEHLPERQHAWRHGVALLSWAERAVKRVRHRRQQSRQRVSMVMHSFAPVHAPAQLLQMASSSALERVFSMRRFHVRCCFIPDVAPGNCCGTMVAARSSDDLWEHLQTVHGVGRDAYMVRARALQWGV